MSGSLSRIVAVFLLVSFMGACTVRDEVVELTYTPLNKSSSIGVDGKKFGLHVMDKRGRYRGILGYQVEFRDDNIGAVKTKRPVTEIVQNAFEQELQSRKLKIDPNENRRLEIEITAMNNFYQTGLMGATARGIVTLTVKVIDENNTVVEKLLISKVHKVGDIQLVDEQHFVETINVALKRVMWTLFDDEKFIHGLVRA